MIPGHLQTAVCNSGITNILGEVLSLRFCKQHGVATCSLRYEAGPEKVLFNHQQISENAVETNLDLNKGQILGMYFDWSD